MVDYSLIYVIFYSFMMSLSCGLALTFSGMKLRYKPYTCFFMLFIPKAVYNFCRFYIESYGKNVTAIIILTIFCVFFDFVLIVAAFDCSFQEKVVTIAEMDMIFIPVLIIKQTFEQRYQTNENGPLIFDNFRQLLLLMAAYIVAFAVVLFILYIVSMLTRKINFNTKAFDIFGKIALAAYLIIEISSVAGYFEGIMVRKNNILLYFVVSLIWAAVFIPLYMINSYISKKRLLREIEVLNAEKEREYKYYNLMKDHNDEIRRIRHDLNGHFSVLNSLVKNGEYERLEDYVSRLSDDYFKVKRVTYTSNLMADAVISSAVQKCAEKNIKFDFTGTLPDNCFVDDVSLTCIFSNILNNAVEACERVTDSSAFISLEVYNKSGCVVISCKNSKRLSEAPEGSHFSTLKKDSGHGFGVKIIKDVVASYDGVISFEDSGEVFEVSLLLPQKAPVRA